MDEEMRNFALEKFKEGKTFDEVNRSLLEKFQMGASFSTLKKVKDEFGIVADYKESLRQLFTLFDDLVNIMYEFGDVNTCNGFQDRLRETDFVLLDKVRKDVYMAKT